MEKSGGYSDITFIKQKYDNKGNKLGVEEKDISEYDIGKLCSLIREHEKDRIIKLEHYDYLQTLSNIHVFQINYLNVLKDVLYH